MKQYVIITYFFYIRQILYRILEFTDMETFQKSFRIISNQVIGMNETNRKLYLIFHVFLHPLNIQNNNSVFNRTGSYFTRLES